MFAHHCTSCGRRELIFADQLIGLDHTDNGFLMHFTCWCGAEQAHDMERDMERDTERETVAA